jgi:histidinol-phosphate/aromatic aminotransferase/cobyric acid decarboxylase-like protein
MAKHQRPSLEAFAQGAVQQEPAPSAQVVEFKQPEASQPEGQGAKARVRNDATHTTLYLDKAVRKVIKEIALHYDRKPHDLYLEGIDMMLAHYGRDSIKKITGK